LAGALADWAPRTALRLAPPDAHTLGRIGEALVARRLAVDRRLICAAPSYIEKFGMPRPRRAGIHRIVEVKTRRVAAAAEPDKLAYRPLDAIGPARQARLERATRRLVDRLGGGEWVLTAGEVLVSGRRRSPSITFTDLSKGSVSK